MLWCRVSALESSDCQCVGSAIAKANRNEWRKVAKAHFWGASKSTQTFCLHGRRRLKSSRAGGGHPGAVGRERETISSLKLLECNSARNRGKEKNRLPPMFSLITEEWKTRPAQPLVSRTSRVDCNRLDRRPARPQNTECPRHRRRLHCPTAIPIVH
jgi:hypothetical protein